MTRKVHYERNKECAKIYHINYYRNHKKSDISKVLQYYTRNRDKLACKTKLLYSSNRDFAKVVLKRARKYYARNRTSICASKRRRYKLAEPKPCVRQRYVLTAKKALLHNKKVMKEVIKYFKSQQESAFEKMNKRSRTAAIAQVAAHRLIAKAFMHFNILTTPSTRVYNKYTRLVFKIVYRLIIVRFTTYRMQTLTKITLPFDM